MITDDQVAALLRDAGNAGPLPRPLDPTVAVAQARRDRSRTHGLAGLAVAVVAVAVLTGPGRAVLSQAAAGGETGDGEDRRPFILGLGLLVAVFVLLGIATPFARRLPARAALRSFVAAGWGALGLAEVGVSATLGAWLFYQPDLRDSYLDGQLLLYLGGETAVVVAVGALCLWLRRLLLPTSVRPLTGALFLLASLQAGTWVGIAMLSQVVLGRVSSGVTPTALVGLLVLLLAALGFGAAALRGTRRVLARAGGMTLLMIGARYVAVAGYDLVISLMRTPAGQPNRAAATAFVVVTLAVGVAVAAGGARLWRGPAARPWSASLLAVLAATSTLAAGSLLETAATVSRPDGRSFTVVSGFGWGLALALLGTVALAAVDRRTPGPGDDAISAAEDDDR